MCWAGFRPHRLTPGRLLIVLSGVLQGLIFQSCRCLHEGQGSVAQAVPEGGAEKLKRRQASARPGLHQIALDEPIKLHVQPVAFRDLTQESAPVPPLPGPPAIDVAGRGPDDRRPTGRCWWLRFGQKTGPAARRCRRRPGGDKGCPADGGSPRWSGPGARGERSARPRSHPAAPRGDPPPRARLAARGGNGRTGIKRQLASAPPEQTRVKAPDGFHESSND